jgi:hypothetical protein
MIWMPEDSDIGMQCLKGCFGVLRTYCNNQREYLIEAGNSRVRIAETSLYTIMLTFTPL